MLREKKQINCYFEKFNLNIFICYLIKYYVGGNGMLNSEFIDFDSCNWKECQV